MSVSTTSANVKFTGELLNGHNWTLWSWEFELGAKEANCWEILTGTESQPKDTEQLAGWRKRHVLAMHQLAKCVNTGMKLKIMGAKTAQDAWTALKSHFESNSGHERSTPGTVSNEVGKLQVNVVLSGCGAAKVKRDQRGQGKPQ